MSMRAWRETFLLFTLLLCTCGYCMPQFALVVAVSFEMFDDLGGLVISEYSTVSVIFHDLTSL